MSTATAESGHEFRLELAEYPKRRGSNMVAGGLLFAGGVAWIAWALTATPDNGADPLPVRLMSLIGLPMIFFGYRLMRRARRRSHLRIDPDSITVVNDWALRRPVRIEREAVAAIVIDAQGRGRFPYTRRDGSDQPLARESGHLWIEGGPALLPKVAISPEAPNLALLFRGRFGSILLGRDAGAP